MQKHKQISIGGITGRPYTYHGRRWIPSEHVPSPALQKAFDKHAVHYSSKKDDWTTPDDLYNCLDEEFRFDFNVCCRTDNIKAPQGFCFDKGQDALVEDWNDHAPSGTFFMNPPYGRGIGDFVKKAYKESKKGCVVVCLLPARTDTKWWHDYVMKAIEVRFVKGRIKFGGAENGAPFPSAIVIFGITESWTPYFTNCKPDGTNV